MRLHRSFLPCSLAFVLTFPFFQPVLAQPLELAADLFPGPPGAQGNQVLGLESFGDWVTFEIDGELWVSDGTPKNTFPYLGRGEVLEPSPRVTAVEGEALYWLQPARGPGEQLWTADLGVRRSARQIAQTLEFSPPHAVESMVALDGTIYFAALSGDTFGIWSLGRNLRFAELLLEMAGGRFPGFGPSLVELGGEVLFLAADADGSPGLWATGGTPQGTRRLATFADSPQQTPRSLTRVGGRVFFLAPVTERELWVSDGTAAGTFPVTTFRSPTAFREPDRLWLHAEGDEVYFLARTPALGDELWVSDGTPAGTRPVTDLAFERPFSNGASEQTFAWLDGRILFGARSDFAEPLLLWRTDGDPGTTAQVAPGAFEPAFLEGDSLLLALEDRVFFLAAGPPGGFRLWITDGTAEGTAPVDPLCQGCDGEVQGVAKVGAEILFIDIVDGVRRELFRTDGTAAGTRRLMTPLEAAGAQPLATTRQWIARAGGTYVLAAFEAVHGGEPWAVPRSGRPLQLAETGGDGPGSFPEQFQLLGEDLVFLGREAGAGGPEGRIYRLEAGSGVPQPLLEAPPWGEGPDAAGQILAVGDQLFVRPLLAAELWRTDGTPSGTERVWEGDGGARWVGRAGERLLFVPEDPQGCELWSTDGAPAGTAVIAALTAGQPCTLGIGDSVGEGLYFLAESPPGSRRERILRSDGTAAGTEVIATLPQAIFPPAARPRFTPFGGQILFLWAGGLWRTEGDAGSTSLLRELPCCATTSPMVELGGSLYFLVGAPTGATSLWRTDGTAAGTVVLRIFPPDLTGVGQVSDPPLVRHDGLLFFGVAGVSGGRELWISDGTASGTLLASDIYPGPSPSLPNDFTAAAGRLFFTATDPIHGRELWVVEGSPFSPRRVQDLNPGPASSYVPGAVSSGGLADSGATVAFDGALFYAASDGLSGVELWRLELDGPPALCTPQPGRLCLQDGRFSVEAAWRDFQTRTGTGTAVPLTRDTGYFWFFDPDNVEAVLKVLDGDLVNGHFWTFYGALSNVEYFLTVRDAETGAARRYFNPLRNFASVGDTFSFGPRGAGSIAALTEALEAAPAAEPVVVESFDASAVGEACVPGSTRLCLQGGRFAVEARWTDFRGRSGVGKAVPLTGDTGYFWFFRDTNVETVLKVLDGRTNNGNFWVFYGALSNVDYDLVVTDCQTGAVKTYLNRGRRFASVGDTMAFPGS